MKKQNLVYWLCQLLGWGLFTALSVLMSLNFGSMSSFKAVGINTIIGVTLLITSHGIRLFLKHKQWTQKPLGWVVPRLLLVILISALSAQVVIHSLMHFVLDWYAEEKFSISNFLIYTVNVSFLFVGWSVLYFAFQYFQSNRKREMENLQLKADLKDAEVTILKSQINPHFLFNALNNIRSLVLSDPEKARDMITHISELLRYFIQFNSQETVTLEQEIAVVEDYLNLESIQFDDRLKYDINIDPAYHHLKIPPMAIQLLAENGIKHGLAQSKKGGTIQIDSAKNGTSLSINVTNTGQLKPSEKGGVGINNLTERMNILYGQLSSFKLYNSSENTVTASFKIPLEA